MIPIFLLGLILIAPAEPVTYPERIGKVEAYYRIGLTSSSERDAHETKEQCEQFRWRWYIHHARKVIRNSSRPPKSYTYPGGTTYHLNWREVYRHGVCVDRIWWERSRLNREKEQIERELKELREKEQIESRPQSFAYPTSWW